MTDRTEPTDRLLAETLHENWDDGPAAGFARQAAAVARRRRQWRQSLPTTGATLVLAGLVAALLARPAPVRQPARHRPAPPGYEIISDDELLAELRDRPLLALRQENGTRQFVLLDRLADPEK